MVVQSVVKTDNTELVITKHEFKFIILYKNLD